MRYEQHAQRLASPLALAGAARCRGLLAAAEGDLDACARHARARACCRRARVPYPLERGRTLLCLGTLRRRATAEEGRARGARAGGPASSKSWARACGRRRHAAELGRISGRRAGGDELTETEAACRRDGGRGSSVTRRSRRRCSWGVSTVEAHLSHVYRKLGIRSRAGLGVPARHRADDGPKPVDGAVPKLGLFRFRAQHP